GRGASRAQRVQAAAGRHLVQPGPDRGTAPAPAQAPPGRQQRLLHRVLGVLRRAEEPVAVHLQLAPVGLDELTERLAVARPGPRQQIRAHQAILPSPPSRSGHRGHPYRARRLRKLGARHRPVSRGGGLYLRDRPGRRWAGEDLRRGGGVVAETVADRADLKASPRQVWTLVLASLGLFMVALDNMVVTLALPALRASLHASLADLEWALNAYLLSFACCLLTGAALGDRFGRRRIFCTGLAVFTAASAWAALSPTVGALIAARAVQGAGAAMVMPLTLTLISDAFPADKRG